MESLHEDSMMAMEIKRGKRKWRDVMIISLVIDIQIVLTPPNNLTLLLYSSFHYLIFLLQNLSSSSSFPEKHSFFCFSFWLLFLLLRSTLFFPFSPSLEGIQSRFNRILSSTKKGLCKYLKRKDFFIQILVSCILGNMADHHGTQ